MQKHYKPQGQITRGKTALNRLRQVDVYMALAWARVLSSGKPLVVDVGYGAHVWTALEMRDRWYTINPAIRLLGIEIDPIRVQNALPYVQPPQVDFRLGGFNLKAILGDEQATIIRAYNVLRQYDEADVKHALTEMSAGLCDGGLLIEGTSNPSGRVVAFDVYQKQADSLIHRALVFGSNLRHADSVTDFLAILPKRLIHHAYDDGVSAFFRHWGRCFALARGAGQHGHRRRWYYATTCLGQQYGYAMDMRERIIKRGFLVLYHPLKQE